MKSSSRGRHAHWPRLRTHPRDHRPSPSTTTVLRSLYASLGIERGPVTPSGVSARVVGGRTLYVNTTAEAVDISIVGDKEGVITGKRYSGNLHLEPYDVDLLQ